MRHTLILLLVSFLLTSCMKTQEKAAVSASSAQEAQTQGTQAVVKSAEALASSQATLASLTTILDEYIKNPSQDLQGLLTQVDLKDLENLPSLLKTMTEEMSKEISEEKMAPLLEALKYFTGEKKAPQSASSIRGATDESTFFTLKDLISATRTIHGPEEATKIKIWLVIWSTILRWYIHALSQLAYYYNYHGYYENFMGYFTGQQRTFGNVECGFVKESETLDCNAFEKVKACLRKQKETECASRGKSIIEILCETPNHPYIDERSCRFATWGLGNNAKCNRPEGFKIGFYRCY